MTQEQYVNNLRGTNEGKDFPQSFLINIYKRVTRQEIRPWKQFPAYILVSQATTGSHTELRLTGNATDLVMRDVRVEKYVATVHTASIAGAICDCTWSTFLPAFSFPLEESHAKDIIDWCFKGFADCITVMCRQGRRSELKAFLSALRAFSHLTGIRPMEYKNVRAIALVMEVAHTYPNELQDCWEEVMRCISWIGRMAAVELLADRYKTEEGRSATLFPDVTALTTAKEIARRHGNASSNDSVGSFGTAGGGNLSRVGSRQRVDFLDADTIETTGKGNAATLFQHISKESIYAVFTESDKLFHAEGLLSMVQCLCKICDGELASQSPSTFMFRCLADVLEANYERKLSVWRQLWNMASPRIQLVVTTPNKNPAQPILGFKVLRKFTLAQLADREISSDTAFMKTVFELYEYITERCDNLPIMESVVTALAQFIRMYPRRIAAGWPAVLDALTNCFVRLPDMHITVAAILHEVSGRYFLTLSKTPVFVAKLFRVWSTIARVDASLEKYALAHVRLLISFLFHYEDPKSVHRACAILRLDNLEDENPAPIPVGAVRPTIPVLNKAIQVLDVDMGGAGATSVAASHAGSDGGLPAFDLLAMGFNELVSLAADFRAGQSLTEHAVEMLLDATAAFRSRAKLRGFSLNMTGRQRIQRSQLQWELLYSQCVLNLVDVYVHACVLPHSVIATAPTAKPQPPTSAADMASSSLVSAPSPVPAPWEKDLTVLVRAPRGRPDATAKSSTNKSTGKAASTYRAKCTTEEVSDMSLHLLEQLVSLLVKQELIIRDEGDGERDWEVEEPEVVDDAPAPEVLDRSASSTAALAVPLTVLAPAPVAVVGTTAEVVDVDIIESSATSPALSFGTTGEAPPSPFGSESIGLVAGNNGAQQFPRVSSFEQNTATGDGDRRHNREVKEEEKKENVLDEARRDGIEEVNLNLVERLLKGLCPCPHEKIRDLGFRALRKLISSRLECAVIATDQAEMTELAKKLNDSLQLFFQEHVVETCLRPPPSMPALESTPVSLTNSEERLLSRRCSSALVDEDLGRLPSEAVLRACINYIDLLGMVMQQEVPISTVVADPLAAREESNNTTDFSNSEYTTTVAARGDDSNFSPSPSALLPVQQEYEGLLDDATTASILQDFRNNYEASSRVLSMDYFSTLHQKDGLSRAAGERVLAMLITFECSISNVFIEMEGSREPVTVSQLASPIITSMKGSPNKHSFAPPPSPGAAASPDAPASMRSAKVHSLPPSLVVTDRTLTPPDDGHGATPSPLYSGGIRNPIQVQVEKFRNFVLNAFLRASCESKKLHALPSATTSMANQQQLLATRTVVRSFLESLQHAPSKIVRRLMPKYRTELCELINSCDEEISPILSRIFLRYLSNV